MSSAAGYRLSHRDVHLHTDAEMGFSTVSIETCSACVGTRYTSPDAAISALDSTGACSASTERGSKSFLGPPTSRRDAVTDIQCIPHKGYPLSVLQMLLSLFLQTSSLYMYLFTRWMFPV